MLSHLIHDPAFPLLLIPALALAFALIGMKGR